MTLTGCELVSSKAKCSSPSASAGEIVSQALEGVLGIDSLGTTSATNKVGLDLYPAGKSAPLVSFACGADTLSVQGSFITPLTADKMLLTATQHAAASKGVQKPDGFLGQPLAGLEESLNGAAAEGAGLVFTITQANEEPVEINTTL